MNKPLRCCNLDWLEVYCFEPLSEPRDPEYFRGCGLWVHERDYGTRVFSQMFTILDDHDQPFVEVRRAPFSRLDEIGILPPNAVHLRLSNRACYFNDAATKLLTFMQTHSFEFRAITRVDVCLDFLKFDTNDDPQAFIRRYVQHVYSKINQTNMRLYGRDSFTGREWNSVAWGNPKSQVSTKLYNKALELAQVHDKPYIRQSWFEAGLIPDPYSTPRLQENKKLDFPPVWRLEFSIKSSRACWYTIEEDGHANKKHSFRNTLETWADRDHCLRVFKSLVPHYFRFKYFEPDKRKDFCRDKELFRFKDTDLVYTCERIATAEPRQTSLDRLTKQLRDYRSLHSKQELREAVDIILSAILDEQIRHDAGTPFSAHDLYVIRQLVAMRTAGDTRTVNELRQLLALSADVPMF